MEDAQLFAQAVNEYKSGGGDAALLAKAYALARGDTKAQEFEYINLRVMQLKSERTKTSVNEVTAAARAEAKKWWPAIKKIIIVCVVLYVGFYALWLLLVVLGVFK